MSAKHKDQYNLFAPAEVAIDLQEVTSDAEMPISEVSPSGAIISGNYRYQLWRIWDFSKPTVLFIMLNPSTADATANDPTVTRCIGFAKAWGYGGIYVGNLFAYRETEPKELLKTNYPIGKENESHLKEMADKCELIVCAWGNSAIVTTLQLRNTQYLPLAEIKKPLHYLELSKDGTPKHPLYLKGDLLPIPFKVPERRDYDSLDETNDNIDNERLLKK